MVKVINALLKGVRVAVAPVESPTVPNADIVSNKSSKKRPLVSGWGAIPPWEMFRRIKAKITTRKELTRRVMDRVTVSLGRVLLSILTSDLPRKRFQAIKKRIARLVVLTPPPQEPGEAPMNIKITKIKSVASLSCQKSTVLKPAVRAVTD
jgi:hypothetical protein